MIVLRTFNSAFFFVVFLFFSNIPQVSTMSEQKAVARQPMQAGNCKKNSFVMLKGRPCKVVEVKTSKTGKHGHAKANITGTCVLTGQKCNEVHPSSHNITEFKIEKIEYLVCDVDTDENKINVLDEFNNMKFFIYKDDSSVALDLAKAIAADAEKSFTVTIVRAPVEVSADTYVDEELIESFRESKERE